MKVQEFPDLSIRYKNDPFLVTWGKTVVETYAFRADDLVEVLEELSRKRAFLIPQRSLMDALDSN